MCLETFRGQLGIRLVNLVVGIDKELRSSLGFRCESTMDAAPPPKSKTQKRKDVKASRKMNALVTVRCMR